MPVGDDPQCAEGRKTCFFTATLCREKAEVAGSTCADANEEVLDAAIDQRVIASDNLKNTRAKR